ncbi:MAG: hypothetical protein H0T79_24185 [Deltaproteobacteria bacterium]|nr:hypothetical protein [Deltaproteobacteria bacterium]
MKLLRFAAGVALLSSGCGDNTAGHCDPEVPGTICTVIGNTQAGYDGDQDQDALDARMFLPQDTVVASDGTLYLLDWNNHRVRSWHPSDNVLRWVAGRGELGGTLDDPANDDFNHPTGLLLSKDESSLLIAAWHNSKIRTIDLASQTITETCGDGRRAYFGDEGLGSTSALDLPSSIAWNPANELVILDQANQVIRRVDAAGIIHRVAGQCVVEATAPCAVGEIPAQCGQPGSGKFFCGGNQADCFKACTPAYATSTNPLELRMAQPFGQSADPGGRIEYDAAGNLYFADTSNHLIRRITPARVDSIVVGVAPVDKVAQSGTSPDGTLGTETKLDRPTDLAIAADGTLYFSDVYNHCVRKLATDGKVYTVAGECGVKGFDGDGAAPTTAHLKLPYGIALVGPKLFIADTGNHVIRVVNLP